MTRKLNAIANRKYIKVIQQRQPKLDRIDKFNKVLDLAESLRKTLDSDIGRAAKIADNTYGK